MTILPCFIHPYSRHITSDIIDTVDKYIDGRISNQLSAATKMKAEDEKSFSRYYKRIVKRCSGWSLILLQWLAKLNVVASWEKKPDVYNKEFYGQWSYFKYLVDQYILEIEKLPGCTIVTNEDKLTYILALLSQNQLGLGP